MNVQEFAALKVGDRIECPMNNMSAGEITAVEKMGVRVRWGMVATANAPTFFYSVQGTAWFHWSKVNMFAPHASDEERN